MTTGAKALLVKRWAPVWLSLLWAWPSLFFIPVILGRDTYALNVMSAAVTIAVGFTVVTMSMILVNHAQTRPTLLLIPVAALLFAALVILPLYYLGVDAGLFGGLGGTRGEAIDIALARLSEGDYPYSVSTSDSQPLTPLPGGLLLAAPASFGLGSAAFMNAYLLPVSVFLVWMVNRPAASILALSLIAAPALWTDVLSEGDLVSTTILAFAVGLLALRSAERDRHAGRWLWPVLLGVAGATRVTTMAVTVIVAALVVNAGYVRIAIIQFSIAVAVFVGLSLPFYVWNPDEFSPLHVARFTKNDFGLALVILATLVLVAWLARSRSIRQLPVAARIALGSSLFAFLVTVLPMLASLDTRADTGELLSGYGVLALVAPVVVLGLSAARRGERSQVETSAWT